MTESNHATRRAVLLGAGAVGAAGILAACGTSGTPTTTPTPGANTGGAAPSPAAIKVADIPVGGGVVYPDQKVVVTQPVAGTFKAFDATCKHLGCTVGDVSGGKINCPCHGSQYNIADGSVARGPTTQALTPKTATVTGATITVT